MSEELKKLQLTDEDARVDGFVYFCPSCMIKYTNSYRYCPLCRREVEMLSEHAGFPKCETSGCTETFSFIYPKQKFCCNCGAKIDHEKNLVQIEKAKQKFQEVLHALNQNELTRTVARKHKILTGEIIAIDTMYAGVRTCSDCKTYTIYGKKCTGCGSDLKELTPTEEIPRCFECQTKYRQITTFWSDEENFCRACGTQIPEIMKQAIRQLAAKIEAFKREWRENNYG